MRSLYDADEAARFLSRYRADFGEELALRVYTSRLLGREPALVLHGGGNTSVKSEARELTGESVSVLFVKGSGWDLSDIEPRGFPACRLEPLRRVAALPALTDEDMMQALRGQMLDPASPTPSVEALLHALLPARFVDHTHADAVLAVVDQPDGEARARDVWGDSLTFVPYVMPGFALAQRVAALVPRLADAPTLILDKHGIFTFGETARESYERMLEAVSAAERAIARTALALPGAPDAAARRERQRQLAPLVRGALGRSEGGQRFILSWQDEPAVLTLLARADAERLTRLGPATPDHVIRTKPAPMWLDPSAEAPAVEARIAEYVRWYEGYFERGAEARGRHPTRLDGLPRVIMVPGAGALTVGSTLRDARIAGDLTLHTARVILDAAAQGGYRPVSELDSFDVEYWSLEQAKLTLGRRPSGPLERRIALVTGAAGGIGLATARRLLEAGAHVLLSDRAAESLDAAVRALAREFGAAVAGEVADVRSASEMARLVARAVEAFGGLDVVVSNAGTAPGGRLHEPEGEAALLASLETNLLSHQYLAAAAARVMLEQGLGGCLLFNASKSAWNPGPDFGPYAVAKAGVVALMRQYAVDLGAHGIRASAVNADRIRTELFGGGVLEARAKARGVGADEYFRQNLLRRETTARDVADAFLFLATAEGSTGAVVTVDGGNPAAFPR
ncbi:MAG: bifunctional aldolase/short-chain dehydrogenase [Sorangiineae bacterium]|nr:bifunctional aldolase/short-chain dehydrogenase [Polyangiaceae bacterium]MEB2322396.1 bifunctional aldolase/short-chain dehydrogenase [Sorangiineae bacterium]